MKRTIIAALGLALANCSYAQKEGLAEKYAGYITVEDAKKHLSIIASDDFEGRETGKPGADKAAKYLESQFKSLGLIGANNGSYFLDIPLITTSGKVTSLEVNSIPLVAGQDFSVTGINSSGSVSADQVVFVGTGSESDLNSVDVAGKVVLCINEVKPALNETMRQVSARFQQTLKNILAKKPALLLITSANNRLRAGGERMLIKRDNPNAVSQSAPTYTISLNAANSLLKESGKTYDDLKQNPQPQTLKASVKTSYEYVVKDAKAVDVVAMLPGSDPKLKDEVLVFSAHYDHIGLTTNGPDKVNNGADDDGSGTTGILEIARAFTEAAKHGHGPRRTILFLGNVGEEKGLLGSEYYTDHPVIPLTRTITDLNIDMIGRTGYEYQGKADSSNYVYVIGSAMLSTTLRKVTEEVNAKYTHLDLDYKYDDPNDPNRFYYRSDHYNFAKHGVPIIFYFDGEHQDYHKPGDEVSKINFPLLVKRAQLVFYTGWDLANRDVRPAVDVNSVPPDAR